MKSFISLCVIAVLVVFGGGGAYAQLDPVGGPYTPDANTVLLLHFDGDLTNAAGTPAAAVAHTTTPGKVSFPGTGVPGLGPCVRLDNGASVDSTYLTVDDNDAFDLTGSWTIEAWANIFSFGDNSQDYRWVPRVVMKPGVDVFWHPNYWLEMWGDNRLFHAGYYTPNDAFISVTSENNMFTPGQWVHLTFIRDVDRGIIAQMVHDVNKNLLSFTAAGFDPAVDVPKTNINPIHIGWAGAVGLAEPSIDSWLDGFVDEIRISNVVRNFAGPPLVTNVARLANQAATLPSYAVTAKIQPFNTGGSITAATLYYRVNGGGWSTVAMSGAGVDYTATIPGQAGGSKIEYYVKATDNNNLSSLVPLTAEAATNPQYYAFYVFTPNVQVLHLTFEEGAGNNPIDHSPNNSTIITKRVPTYSTDAKEGAASMYLYYDRPNIDSGWVEAESPFLAAEEFCIDFWLKADTTEHASRIINYAMQKNDWNNNNYEISFRNNSKGVPWITARSWKASNLSAVVLQDTNAVTLGEWFHVIFERSSATGKLALEVRNQSDVRVYYEIKDMVEPPIMGGSVSPTTVKIGRADTDAGNWWYIPPFRGYLDNVQIFNYPARRITGTPLDPVGGPYTADANTVLLLHFDGDLTNAAAAGAGTPAAAVANTTNPAKVYFLNNTGVPALGQCVRLDNGASVDSTYLTVEDNDAFDLTGSWTIEAWANIFSFGDNSQDYRWVPRVVMKPGVDVFWHPNYWLEMWGDNRLFHAGYYTPNDAFISVTSEINMFTPGQWVHLTFIRDVDRGIIAQMVHDVNKNLLSFTAAGFDPAVDVPKTNINPIHIGWAGAKVNADPSIDSWLDGFVDEIRISNVVRNFAGPPLVTNVARLANQAATLPNYTVTAKMQPFNAGGSIVVASLYYRVNGGGWQTVALSGSGVDYTGAIPGQAGGSKIEYYVKATDNNNLSSLVPLTAEAATNPQYYAFYVFTPNVQTLWLTFEEGAGNNPIDHSQNNSTILTKRVPTYSTDAKEGAASMYLYYDRPNIDSGWVEAESPFLAAEEFCIDFWLKADTTEHASRIINYAMQKNDWNNNNYEISFRNNSKGVPWITGRSWKASNLSAVVIQDSNLVSLGKWFHVIFERSSATGKLALEVRDENDTRVFYEMKAMVEPPIMGGSVAPTTVKIGRADTDAGNWWYIPPFRGYLDNVQIFNYPSSGISGVTDPDDQIPLEFSLRQNYPNPFNPTTRIEFTLPKAMKAELVVYDLTGRRVKTLVNEEKHAGQHFVQWDGTNSVGRSVSSGTYFYKLTAGSFTKVEKMMLVR